MKKISSLKVFIILVISTLWFAGCKSAIDEQYERPTWLEPPVYEQLKDRGNFNNYLACVDKADYTNQLNGSGYYTVFAPTDSAFSAFLSENGYSSVDDIDSTLAKKIVAYSLCVSPASYDEIDDFQDGSSSATEASTIDKAFKRTTYFYKWVYQETDVNDTARYVIDINSSLGEIGSGWTFYNNDFNQKNIPFFTSAFMNQRGISATDYNYFYPNTELTDFNVVDAQVIEKDIWAENGIIHVVNKVIPPLRNLEEILAETDDCSEFKYLLDKFIVTYDKANDNFQLKYEQSSGARQDVFMKYYDGTCINLNCENYLTYLEFSYQMDAQTDGYTLFAPNNAAMTAFYNDKFFKYGYNSLDKMPDYVLQEFVNAHLFTTTVWPTRFDLTMNLYGENARFDAYADVTKKEFGSNGIFYAVNKVQATNAFSTVLCDVLLNPDYSLLYQALIDVEPLAENLKSTTANYLLFLISNDQFKEVGLAYNSSSGSWEFTDDPDRPNIGSTVSTALSRLLYTHIILLGKNDSYDLMNGTGVIKNYGEEYIRYIKGSIFGSGNIISERPKIQDPVESGATNGQSYSLSRAMLFSDGNIGQVLTVSSSNKAYKATQLLAYLEKIATATYITDDGVETYVSSCVYNVTSEAIKDISNTNFITVFLPNDEAISQAVNDGVLKSIGDFANGILGAEVLSADNLGLEQFIKYHIVNNNIVVGDVLSTDITTYRKLDDGTYATLHIEGDDASSPGTLTITDNQGRTANVITTTTVTYNILGNRAIVHVIDNYLTY